MRSCGIDILGDDSPALPGPMSPAKPAGRPSLLREAVVGILCGALGYLGWRRHKWLGLASGYAVGSNGYRLATGTGSRKNSILKLASTGSAVAGSLYLPVHPAIGFVAGAGAGQFVTSLVGDDD